MRRKSQSSAMRSLSDFQLYWADDRPRSHSPSQTPIGQYVFEASVEQPFSLHRVRGMQDVLSLLSGGRKCADWLTVAGMALLYGNLVATGQWLCLICFLVAGLLPAVLELPTLGALVGAALAWLLLNTVWSGLCLQWLAVVGVQVILSLAGLIVGWQIVQEDPRSYALVPERADSKSQPRGQLDGQDAGPTSSSGVVIHNHCCMDIKLLVFDGRDIVRLVPRGGLLGGTRLPRGASHNVGDRPPYVIKAYQGMESELGTFLVGGGTYSFRATAPPVRLLPSTGGAARFTNCTEAPVRICTCSVDSWCCSLWLPFAQFVARLIWGTTRVAPGEDVAMAVPCTLRVYDAGMLGTMCACCRVQAGERAEYLGSLRWTSTGKRVSRSCSSLLNSIS